jgi:hypothetical protein
MHTRAWISAAVRRRKALKMRIGIFNVSYAAGETAPLIPKECIHYDY